MAGGGRLKRKVLITGGAGYLGYKFAKRLLAKTDEELVLWLRANDADAFVAKRRTYEPLFAEHPGRVSFAWGDLSMPAPFESVDASAIKTIFHPPADTRFNIDETTADIVNVAVTNNVLAR